MFVYHDTMHAKATCDINHVGSVIEVQHLVRSKSGQFQGLHEDRFARLSQAGFA